MIEKFNFIKDWKRYRKTAAIKYDWETYEE